MSTEFSISSTSTNTTMPPVVVYLPEDFKPTETEVIIGRGRKIQQHAGNVKLKELVLSKAKEYVDTADKSHKSLIISQLGNRIKSESAHGGFVKKDPTCNLWYAVSQSCVRATIAQSFRDSLSPNYRSSKFSKQRRRWTAKTANNKKPQYGGGNKQATSSNAQVGGSTPAFTPLGCSVPASKPLAAVMAPQSVTPVTMLSLQRAAVLPPLNSSSKGFFDELPTVPSSFSGSKATSDILKKCLEILDDDEVDAVDMTQWFSYSENPFEPIPIEDEEEPIAVSASNTSWWL